MEVESSREDYFSSYEDLEIHRLMLEDDPRTDTYRQAILGNKNYFKDKIVMDVGCGTGILSIFCAQAGAAKAYAIEASNIAHLAKDVIKDNKLEHIIEIHIKLFVLVGSCEGVRCGGEKRCVLDVELGAHCVRCGGCSEAGAPVCAVDGSTYAGACALRKAACERGKALPLAYKGSCIANATCARVRCGAGQRCVSGGASGARCVSCGACGGGSRRPICGSDARTYPSWCRLQRAACHAGRVVDLLHPGPCKEKKNITDNSVTEEKHGEDVATSRVL